MFTFFFSDVEFPHCMIHVKGMKGIAVGGGATGIGYYGGVEYNGFINNKIGYQVAVNYETGNVGANKIKVSLYYLEVAASYSFYSINRKVFFNVVAGGSGSMGTVNDEMEVLKEVNGNINYGAIGGGLIEIYPNGKFTILLEMKSRYFIKESFGKQRWKGGIGLRYNF